MRISEVAGITGLNVSNIRFYERKGLLAPVREEESKYRDYTEEDVRQIKRILLYRKMGISVETIYLLLHGQTDIRTVLLRQRSELQVQMDQLQGAMELCQMVLERDQIADERLDEYLNYVHEEEQKGKQFAQVDELLEDLARYTGAQVFHGELWFQWLLWRPWAAKVLSLILWLAVLAVPVLHLLQVVWGKGELSVPLLVVYGILIVCCGVGFWKFRQAGRKYFEGEDAGE